MIEIETSVVTVNAEIDQKTVESDAFLKKAQDHLQELVQLEVSDEEITAINDEYRKKRYGYTMDISIMKNQLDSLTIAWGKLIHNVLHPIEFFSDTIKKIIDNQNTA